VLRTALGKNPPTTGSLLEDKLDLPATAGNLVLYVDQSRRAWRASGEYREGIDQVHRWTRSNRFPVDPAGAAETIKSEQEPGQRHARDVVANLQGYSMLQRQEEPPEYDLERDVKAHLMQYTRSSINGTQRAGSFRMQLLPARPIGKHLRDVRFHRRFPYQQVSIRILINSVHSDYKHAESPWNIFPKRRYDKVDSTQL